MNNPSYFANAQGTTIGSHANFQIIHRDANITNNYQCTHGEDRMVVGRKTIRRIFESDVNYQRVLSSEILSVRVGSGEQGLTSNGPVVRVRRTVQTAEIFQCPGTFTATTLEPVDDNDRDKFELIARRVLEAATSRRSALLTQLFAVVDSDPLTLIAYNELVNGYNFVDRYGEQKPVVYYLEYTFSLAIQSLREDETVTFPVTNRWEDWSFNIKTLAWHFDPASISLSPPSELDLKPSSSIFAPLRQQTLRELDADKIIACVEENFGDLLFLVATSGGRRFTHLSNYARHDLLTFGTVVDSNKPGILAHFPSTPAPEWFCRSRNPDVKAAFSASVPWRVDFSFRKTGDIQVKLDFGFRVPEKVQFRLGAAYLCQSISFLDGCNHVGDFVYINEVVFELNGTFHDDPTTRSTPAFLIFPPLPIEIINGMYCIEYPFPSSLFYWSFDRQGKRRIAEDEYEEYNIPELLPMVWIGSRWDGDEYIYVRDVLSSRNYNLDGRQYARDHRYPELIRGDPHDANRFEDLKESEPAETPDSHSRAQLTSPSTLSLLETIPEALPIVPTAVVSFAGSMARGFLNKFFSRENTL